MTMAFMRTQKIISNPLFLIKRVLLNFIKAKHPYLKTLVLINKLRVHLAGLLQSEAEYILL